ncbi:MAG: hypothetical protein ACM3JE_03975 [Betaproteobacteria bacterium]
MGKVLEKYAYSVRFWVLVVASVYLGYALYFAVYGLNFSLDLTHNQYVYNLVTKDPWWWQILYYGSEGVTGSVAIVLRAIAGFFAFYVAFLYWRNKPETMQKIRRNARIALLCEAGFFLALIPSVIAAFAYNLSTEYLFYFDHTPELILLFGTAIPCLGIVMLVPPFLLKLRGTIKDGGQTAEIVKWSCLTGLAYLFVVFWFNYSMLWAASMVPYPQAYELTGWAFALVPLNLVSFLFTVVGLVAVALAATVIVIPVIRNGSNRLNLAGIGAVMVALGGYFVFHILYYYLTGGYEAHPGVWYEVISPMHNPNLWALSFIFVGVPLIIQSLLKTIHGKQNK